MLSFYIIRIKLQFPQATGSSSNEYTVAVRLMPNENFSGGSSLTQQSVRTCGTRAVSLASSEHVSVTWNEIFFFKIKSLVSNLPCFNICVFSIMCLVLFLQCIRFDY